MRIARLLTVWGGGSTQPKGVCIQGIQHPGSGVYIQGSLHLGEGVCIGGLHPGGRIQGVCIWEGGDLVAGGKKGLNLPPLH